MSNFPPTGPSSPLPTPAPAAIRQTAAPHSSPLRTIFSLLVVAVAGGLVWHYQEVWRKWIEPSKVTATKPPRVVPVSVAVVKHRDMPIYLNGLGTVTAFKTVTVRSRVEGELKHVGFTEGQMVQEGDLLAEIDPRMYEVQLAQAEGQLARDQATLKTAKITLSRYEGLAANKSIAAQQVDDQATLVQQTMASILTDEALIDNAKLQLTYCRITAPITGRIGLRLVDQGNIVRANEPGGLAVITQLQPIALVFTIPQDDIARVQRKANDKIPLKVMAYDRDFKQQLAEGQLLAIDNQVDATTGTVRLKAEFKNEDGMLFPNQFVNARLLVDTKPDAIIVPSAAVQRGPASMFVYVAKSDDTVELRTVVPGPSEGPDTSIESGLSAGEIVVTDGLDKLQPGAKISFRDSGKEGKAKGDKKEGGGEGHPKKEATEKNTEPKMGTERTIPSAGPGPSPKTAERVSNGGASETPTPSPAESKAKPATSCGESADESDDGRNSP